MGRTLARALDLRAGDPVVVEDVEGVLKPRAVTVAALLDDMVGMSGYMELGALHRLQRDGGRVTSVALRVDPARRDDLLRRIKALPAVAAASRRESALDYFRYETTRMSSTFTLLLAVFASVIAVGVVYNNARIALSVRSRELATLRVLGFTRAEVSTVLSASRRCTCVVALPVGLLMGRGLAALVLQSIDVELFRMPLVISHKTYGFAVGVVIAASVASALIVRRRIDALDMVSVLKSRD